MNITLFNFFQLTYVSLSVFPAKTLMHTIRIKAIPVFECQSSMTVEVVYSSKLFDEFYFQKNVLTVKYFEMMKDSNSCNLEAFT